MVLWIEKAYYALIVSLLLSISACGDTEKNNTTPQNSDEPQPTATNTITLFTFRHYPTDQELLQQFRQLADTDVKVVQGTEAELMEKLEQGETADVFLAGSIQAFYPAKHAKLTQPFFTELTGKNVPSRNTDMEGYWLGLSRWAPVFIYNKEKVDPAALQNYSDITRANWRGKVAVGSVNDVSLQTIAAAMLSIDGKGAAQKWIAGLAANRSAEAFSDDFAIIKAVAEGRAEVGIIKGSSLFILQRSGDPGNFKTAEAVGLVYPANKEKITYHNLTVAGLLMNTQNREAGLRLIEYLSGQTAQEPFAEAVYEFPVHPFAIPSDFLLDIGGYREGTLDLNVYGKNQEEVIALLAPLGGITE